MKIACPRCMPPGDPCCPYCNGTYGVDAGTHVTGATTDPKDATVADLRRQVEELQRDITHAVACAKEYSPDYPWSQNTASEAVWALGEGMKGMELACDDAHKQLAEARGVIEKLPKTADGAILRGAMPVFVVPAALEEQCWLIYKREHPTRAYKGSFNRIKGANVVMTPAPINGGNYVLLATCPENTGEPCELYVRMEFVYSTREAALAAQEPRP